MAMVLLTEREKLYASGNRKRQSQAGEPGAEGARSASAIKTVREMNDGLHTPQLPEGGGPASEVPELRPYGCLRPGRYCTDPICTYNGCRLRFIT